MKRSYANILAITLTGVLTVVSISPVNVLAAKKKTPKLTLSKVTVTIGQKRKITVKNVKSANVRMIKWTVNKKGRKIVKLTKKSKKAVTVKGLKKGKATVTAKIKTKTKAYTKKLHITVEKTDSAVPKVTKMPVSTAEPEPPIYGKAGEVSAYDKEKSNYTLDIDASNNVHEISNMLYGISMEDINFAADGGLYAEMVQNRSFEFTQLASGNEKHAWSDVGTVTANVRTADSAGCLNANNPNYMVLENASSEPAGIANQGFLEGMSVTADAKYNFSIWAKGLEGYTGPIHVAITKGADTLAEGEITSITSEWEKYELELIASETASSNVKLQITIDTGKAAVDMVSLFPEDTYKGRANGLRKDLAEMLEELHPAFLRFPGGCVVEGSDITTAYNWKDSIGIGADGEPLAFNGTYGDVAARKQGQNIWTKEMTTNDDYPSFMTYGLGFYEYFLLAEDIGAIGVPVVNCGISCMSQPNPHTGRPDVADVQSYIQDALDLVEFCRGDASTKWGAVRIVMGHFEPFDLKYIGIGNEQWGKNFYEHYEAFVEAFNKAKLENPEMYGDIELMYTAGLDDGDSGRHYMAAYAEAAKWLKANPDKTITDFAGIIDHHYYNTPNWFLCNADYYDEKNYSRDAGSMTTTKFGGGLSVFLGEYASYSNTWHSALSEAAYMTGLERNGDIVKMAAYAPLFGNPTARHWSPNLIWFNSHTATHSVNYWVQKVFSDNAGTALLGSSLTGAARPRNEFKGKIGVGTWNASAAFDNVMILDNDSGQLMAYDIFDSKDSLTINWEKVSDGNWSVKNGKLVQSNTFTNTAAYEATGSAIYFGDANWKNYTYTVDAIKTGGQEGFLIPFAIDDSKNNYFWNIGGWDNTVSCLQSVKDGYKSDQIDGTVKNITLETGKIYKLKVTVNGYNVKCYVDDVLYVDYTLTETANAESYQVVSTDATGDIIVKLVNVTGYPKTFAIDIAGAEIIGDTAKLDLVAGNSLADNNILGQKEAVALESSDISGITKQFNYTVPKYSVSALRIQAK